MRAVGEIDQATVLGRWRETRSSRLADLLCCVPVDDAWHTRLEHLAALVATKAGALSRVPLLPDDPRTTVFLIEQLAAANWSGPNARELWILIFDRLVELRDVRCLPKLRALAAKPPLFFQPKMTKWIASEWAFVEQDCIDLSDREVSEPLLVKHVEDFLALFRE